MYTLIFFFLLISIPYITTSTTDQVCEDQIPCSGAHDFSIRFPFRFKDLQPEHCGYPGFELSCTENKETVLELPFAGKFVVRNIDYNKKEIEISDPFGCFPSRLFNFNLSSSPFHGKNYMTYTFFNCSKDFPDYLYTTITCLNSSSSAYNIRTAASDFTIRYLLPEFCKIMRKVSVPRPASDQYLFEGNNVGVTLTWDKPECGKCESERRICEFQSYNTSLAVGCSQSRIRYAHQGGVKNGTAIGSSIALFVLLVATVVIIRACKQADMKQKEKRSLKNEKFVENNKALKLAA